MKKLLLFLLVALFSVNLTHAEPVKREFNVSAEAEVKVKPDRATITLGINTRNRELKAGKDQIQKTMAEALSYCKKSGVEEKNIQTAYMSIVPNYSYKENTRIVNYELSQSFTVTLTDLTKFEGVVYGLLERGINTVENVYFESSELRKHRDAARLLAVKAAQEKAKLLADAAGVRLGKVVNVSESGGWYRPYSSFYSSRNMMAQNVSQNMSGGGGDGEEGAMAAGSISITASVNLTYELE